MKSVRRVGVDNIRDNSIRFAKKEEKRMTKEKVRWVMNAYFFLSRSNMTHSYKIEFSIQKREAHSGERCKFDLV